MLSKFRLFTGSKAGTIPASIPEGQRVYAIGDIHGRADLLSRVATAIEEDDACRAPASTTVILLGDLIDRGPESAAVIDMVQRWSTRRRVRVLAGNHEEMFHFSFSRLNVFETFLKFGGRETVLSYGVDSAVLQVADPEEARQMMIEAVPMDHREFIMDFEKLILIGDYLFVHAGVRPGFPLEEQSGKDCRWIREPFLSHPGDFGCVVVHGHTISTEVEVRHNRIGIDTGAFMSGRLSAIGLEGTDRWLLEARVNRDAIDIPAPRSLAGPLHA